ncbi:MAG: family 78 glycoside hydrolase catalytic domain, partial [Kiritimatiellae bacterium]|nr:family 78 glycoside hydrolase catalytic domain [Kiritimatiellia bacterium]
MERRRSIGLFRGGSARIVVFAFAVAWAAAAQSAAQWPMELLKTPPQVFEAPQYATNGVRALFYEGLPYKGRATRVFAYLGVPEHAAGERVPAMVLVHGGGGSAFIRWVKFWNSKGYAAISMDTCGKVSGNAKGGEQRGHFPHEWSGPAGWGGFATVNDLDEDHWMYHAVAAVVRANSLVRSLRDVDPERVGLTGVSWGGIITCTAASIDGRFRFAAPVYGCGANFTLAPAWQENCGHIGQRNVPKWRSKWDPISYLPQCAVPIHWLDGTNDPWFALPAIERCREAMSCKSGATFRIRMVHTHGRVSEEAGEIVALADGHLRGGPALPQFGEVRRDGRMAVATFSADGRLPPVRACLDYTLDPPDRVGLWFSRKWASAPATIGNGEVSARLPDGAKAWYLNLETKEGLRTSSHVVAGIEERPLATAKWLWPKALGCATNVVVDFVREFSSGVEAPVKLAIAADTVYRAELNGRLVGTGRFPDTPPQRYYDVIPAGNVAKGRNVLKVSLYVQGIDSFQHIPGDPGLMFSLFGDGVSVVSDASVKWRKSAKALSEGVRRVTNQLGFSFEYDAAAKDAPWHGLAQSDASRGEGYFILNSRPVPCVGVQKPVEEQIVAQGVLDSSPTPEDPAAGMDATHLTAVPTDKFFMADGRSVLGAHFPSGFYVVVDLGREETGFLEMDIDTDEGTVVDVGHAEHMESGRVRVKIGPRGFAGRYRARGGRQRFVRWEKRMAGRFVQIHVRGARTHFKLYRLSVSPVELPLAEQTPPKDLNALQRRIWDVSARTLRLCMHEHYEDCPWREQALYANDARNQMLSGYYAFGKENRMPELSIALLSRGIGDDDWLELCMPARIAITIPSFTFCWVLSVDDHLRHRRDIAFTRSMMPTIRRILTRRIEELEDGLLPNPSGERYWHFYEWSNDMYGYDSAGQVDHAGDGHFDAPLNLLFVMALEAGARCGDAVGDRWRAGLWRDAAARVRTSVRRRLWDVDKNEMATRLGAGLKPSELVQSLALLADAVPPEARLGVANRLASGSDWTETTLSQSLYKFEALAAFGGEPAKSVLPKMEGDWSAMLEKGATSFWEMREGAAAFRDAGSLCHGWSALPIYIYGAHPELRKGNAVETGSVVESGAGVASVETLAAERLGGLAVEFKREWTPEEVRATGERCRALGMKFRLDELFDRRSGRVKAIYAPRLGDILAAAREYSDVCAGSGLFYETGGVLYYWQHPAVSNAAVKIPPFATFSEAERHVSDILRRGVSLAEKTGLPRPFVNIEASFGFASALFRAGYDQVDLEVIYGPDQERCYAGVKTAAETFGRRFGVDMAMAWYGGVQHDALWDSRWRTSLFHAFMRGADPIYLEHGLMSFEDQGLVCGPDHPYTKAMRAGLAEIAAYARANPRPAGFPRAAVAAVQGRNDGFVGGFQTHLYGQRTNDLYRLTEADRSWELFDGLYCRRAWHDRNAWGGSDYSGNPPLGAADILPHDAPDEAFAKYNTLFLLGRNTMDDALYGRLVRYVERGGTLVISAFHLNVADRVGVAFEPYNGGDWSRLAGVRVVRKDGWLLPHGIKFTANPAPGWRFDPLQPDWDPQFADGGFSVADVAPAGAKPFAVSSDRFADVKFDKKNRPILFSHDVGKGHVIFLASIDPPGADGVKRLYAYLLDKAMEAVDVWPKVECSDRVRYAVYPDGTVYLLNTEANLRQEAIVRSSVDAEPMRVLLN